MKHQTKSTLLMASALSVAFLSSCRTRTMNEGNKAGSSVKAAVPSNTERVVNCDLAPLTRDAKKAKFRGRDIEYFSSKEIGYHKASWWNASNQWISNDILDSSILGYPGIPGTDRTFGATQPVNARVVAVDVRNIEGTLHYHYFSNETATSPMENWSSTKALAIMMAAHTLRRETGIGFRATSHASSSGPAVKWVGDSVTVVADTSSNEYAVWFKSIVGGQQSDNFAKNWLYPGARFGAGHGANPQPLGSWFKYKGAGTAKQSPRAGKWAPVGDNTLMPIAMVEFWKRLAVNTDDPITWLKNADYTSRALDEAGRQAAFFQDSDQFGLTEEDLKVILYGQVDSTANGGLALGANDNNSFVDAFGGKAKLDRMAQGKWRYFGKTGGGGTSRSSGARNEAILGGTFCLPAGTQGEPQGRLVAFFVNIQASGSAGGPRQAVLANLASAMVPSAAGGTNLWGSAPQIASAAAPVEGEAVINADNTVLKAQPVDSSTLVNADDSKPDQKCSVPRGTVLAYHDRQPTVGNHMRLKLKFADQACPHMPTDVYVFAPHWTFNDKP